MSIFGLLVHIRGISRCNKLCNQRFHIPGRTYTRPHLLNVLSSKTTHKMPFPVEKLCGTWKVRSLSASYPLIFEKIGVPAEMVQNLREAKIPMNASLAGDKFTHKMEFMGKQQETTFTLGVVGEEDDPFVGGKRRVVYTIEGDHLVALYPDYNKSGTSVRLSHHLLDDNTIHTDIKAGDLEGWHVLERC
ncbi:uncharacterized protein [Branchiostoma lanceolatum]|uniref:uncharacterized protein n=1 Tax=Branchiostoma lanceolatum TaxID=7740 RepID=UPI003453004F